MFISISVPISIPAYIYTDIDIGFRQNAGLEPARLQEVLSFASTATLGPE